MNPRNALFDKSWLALAVTVLIVAIGCKQSGRESGSKNALISGPSSTSMSGTWAGTMSRPGGLAPLGVRWQVTHSEINLSGPMTLTNGSGSVTFQISGTLGGNASEGYGLFLNFSVNPGGISTLPNCSITSVEGVRATGLREPITAITTDPFALNYFNCQGFIDPDPAMNFHRESTQLAITKQ